MWINLLSTDSYHIQGYFYTMHLIKAIWNAKQIENVEWYIVKQ